MKTIQEKIIEIKDGTVISALSLCNIDVMQGRVIIANQHKMSPLLITNQKEVDRDVPVATYCIAVPTIDFVNMLGREVILDMSYGSKGVSINSKITNNAFKLVDVLGGLDNIDWKEGHPVITDKNKVTLCEDGRVEFWDINLVSLNQIGGIVNN